MKKNEIVSQKKYDVINWLVNVHATNPKESSNRIFFSLVKCQIMISIIVIIFLVLLRGKHILLSEEITVKQSKSNETV